MPRPAGYVLVACVWQGVHDVRGPESLRGPALVTQDALGLARYCHQSRTAKHLICGWRGRLCLLSKPDSHPPHTCLAARVARPAGQSS